MPPLALDVLGLLGLLIRFLGFLAAGFALGNFTFDAFKTSPWQLQIALALGLFGLLIGLTAFSSPGSAGAFALGLAGAYFMVMMPGKAESEEKKAPKAR